MDNNETQKPEDTKVPELDLDLGIEDEKEEEVVLDYELAYSKLKPTAQRIFKLLNVQPTGNSQEELEVNLTALQTAYEKDTKDILVPAILAKLQSKNSSGEATRKVGMPTSQTKEKPRVIKPFTGY